MVLSIRFSNVVVVLNMLDALSSRANGGVNERPDAPCAL